MWRGDARMVPTFAHDPIGGFGAQLCPCSLATGTPQAFPHDLLTGGHNPVTELSIEVDTHC